MVSAIKNIKAGKRPASEPAFGGSTLKSRKMAGSLSSLSSHARLETQKGDQPASTQVDEPMQVETGSQDPPQVNELVINPSEAGHSIGNQGADEVAEKVAGPAVVEKTTEEEEKN
ncbi:hypothetical protein FNV43_RR13091 [Rhamnella rubrinervis]|uniref:Uncharacterized protein n=1 Tax=Rhamnella rubrinervis TaxID=2594499 RepID=A0A8K0H0H6_9ROSA|nr:hypothetical protein FNV43_RR13091 [Rhamnella rubrinervis]